MMQCVKSTPSLLYILLVHINVSLYLLGFVVSHQVGDVFSLIYFVKNGFSPADSCKIECL